MRKLRKMTLEEVLRDLSNAGIGDLYLNLEDLGRGKFVLSDTFLTNLLASKMDGTLRKISSGEYSEGYHSPAAGTSTFLVTVPTGEYWELKDVLFLVKCGVAVANRSLGLYINPIPGRLHDFGVTTLTAMWSQTAVTLSASEQGGVWITDKCVCYNDNGTLTYEVSKPPLPAVLFPGGTIGATVSNFQAADIGVLSVLYKKLQVA